jgi:two-component system chemotaxis sensor kinase CheA
MLLDMDAYFEVFIEEATEVIGTLDLTLVRLERSPKDEELVREAFRAAHTLKGSSAAMGYEGMARIAHALENVLDRVRKGEAAVTSDVFDALLSAVDALKAHLQAALAKVEAPERDEALMQALEALTGTPSPPSQAASERPAASSAPAPSPGVSEWTPAAIGSQAVCGDDVTVRVTLSPDCTMPAARAWLILRQIEAWGEVVSSEPSMEAIKRQEVEPYSILVSVVLSKPGDEMVGALRSLQI